MERKNENSFQQIVPQTVINIKNFIGCRDDILSKRQKKENKNVKTMNSVEHPWLLRVLDFRFNLVSKI